jgi:hypothetical protein
VGPPDRARAQRFHEARFPEGARNTVQPWVNNAGEARCR